MPDHDEFKVIQFLHPEGTEPFERKLNAAAAEGFEFLGLAGVEGSAIAVLRKRPAPTLVSF